ncbi:MAG: hypothetical protein K2X93_27180 [Candidatus Obscuribacterales bacterium]|nr:hypothetical protein [Candidatus Obscuribacterales bacterium]
MYRFWPACVLALTLTLSGASLRPAKATDISKLFNSAASVGSVDVRQSQLERRIKDAVSSGRLTRNEAQPFYDEIEKISDLEATFKASSSNLSTWESLKLLFQLDTLSRQFEQSLGDRTISGADLDARIHEIEARLADARHSRRLTDQEANEFTYELNRIKLLKGAYSVDGAVLSDNNSLQIALSLDTLSARLESTMHDRQYQLPSVDKLQVELEKRISDGIASGKLDEQEAKDLKQEFQRIADREAQLKRFGRPLTSVETLELALDLEKLSTSVEKFSITSSVLAHDFKRKKEHIREKIAAGLVSGKLTLGETYRLKEQLSQLDSMQSSSSQSDAGINEAEKKALALELEKLSSAVNRRLVDLGNSSPGISERLETLDRRISTAQAKGRLTDAETSLLSADLKRISAKWRNYDHGGDDRPYPLDESLSIATSIEQLAQKLSDSLHDRTVEVPKLNILEVNLDDRIAYGVTSGKLSLMEAKKLLEDFNAISQKKAGLSTAYSTPSDRDRLMIGLELQQLTAKVERGIHDSTHSQSLDDLKAALNDQLNEGIASGKLTDSESTSLKGQLSRIKTEERSFNGLTGKLRASAAVALLKDWKEFQTSLNEELKDSEIASPDLNKRVTELQARIAVGVNNGNLTNTEAVDLRKELARIREMERDYTADGGISRGEAVTLSFWLEKLAASIEASMHDTKVDLPSISRIQEEIDRKLANAVVDGTCSLDDIEKFTAKLEDIARLELSFRYSGDGLSYAESATIKTELDKLTKLIDATLASSTTRWTGLDEGIANTSKRITDGITTKRLTADVGNTLKSEVDRIQKAKIAFAHSQGGYDLEETESLVHDLDRLNAEIDLRFKGQNFAWSDIDRRQQNIELLMKQGIKTGKLNSGEARRMRNELDRIKRAKSAFTMSDGSLNYFERVSLAEALDKLDNMMRRRTR